MSDESISPAEEPSAEAATTPKVRRISNKNPKKTAKPAKQEAPAEEDVPVEEFDSTPPSEAPDKSDPSDKPETSKKKNRRRRGKGKSSQKDGESPNEESPVSEETINLVEAEPKESNQRNDKQGGHRDQQNQRPQQKQRSRIDPEKVAKNAWKIYLAEVSEEGVALIGDNDARELARRCFRLSEIFLEEEGRRN